MAFVRGPIARQTASGEIWKFSSTSTITGVAPRWTTTLAVAQNVSVGTITSSPGPTPSAANDVCSAAVHEFTAIACFTPTYVANSCSKRLTFGPVVIQPDRRLSVTSAISSSPINGRQYGRNELRIKEAFET